MTTKMEMSLDDIIKQNKGKNKGGNRSGGRKGGASTGGKSGGSPKRGPVRSNRKPGGGVIRNRNRGAISRNSGSNFRFSLPSHKREAFLGSSSNSSRRFNSNTGSTVLIVSNLDFGVTNSDIVELFSEFGPLKSAGVHYDRSGRSLGSADLIFERRSDAIKAMKQYNGVPLDGREMNIQLATSEIPSMNTVRNSRLGTNSNSNSNSNNSNSKSKGSTNRNRGPRTSGPNKNRGTAKRGAKPGGGPRNKKPAPPTAEELDAQLEEYVKSKVTNSEGA